MIKRISQVIRKSDLQALLPGLQINESEILRYNISPLKAAYIVNNKERHLLQKHQWGLIPFTSTAGQNSGTLINARIEQLPSSPSFRIPIRKQRCIVPVDSFYTWRKKGKQDIPYRIYSSEQPVILLAGLWDIWTNGKIIKLTFSIMTRKATGSCSTLTDRMPVIFTPDQGLLWLDDISLEEVMTLAVNGIPAKLQAYKITEKINSTSYESEDLHKKELYIPTLFDQ